MRRYAGLVVLLVAMGCARRTQFETRPVPASLGVDDETPRWSDEDLAPGNVLGADETAWAMLGTVWLPLGLMLGIAGWLTVRHRRRARREAEAVGEGPLADGPAVLQGVVEPDGDDALVVTLAQQRHVLRDKQGRSHVQWHEKRRSMTVRPFPLRLADGRVVRVEPDASVLLRDAVDEVPEPVDDNHRVRRVRLRAGERVWATGVLSGVGASRGAGAYREGGATAVLRPGRFGRMVVSTEAPGAYDTARAAYHRG